MTSRKDAGSDGDSFDREEEYNVFSLFGHRDL